MRLSRGTIANENSLRPGVYGYWQDCGFGINFVLPLLHSRGLRKCSGYRRPKRSASLLLEAGKVGSEGSVT